MSANNQTLVKEHKGKWYVFPDINAESWSERNEISHKEGFAYDTIEEAYKAAEKANNEIDDYGYGIEYGVSGKLIKDGADVNII